jgi:hypothetical protein
MLAQFEEEPFDTTPDRYLQCEHLFVGRQGATMCAAQARKEWKVGFTIGNPSPPKGSRVCRRDKIRSAASVGSLSLGLLIAGSTHQNRYSLAERLHYHARAM